MVFAVIGTGVENVACCQPEAVSPVNVTDARSVPVAVHKCPVWVPVFELPL